MSLASYRAAPPRDVFCVRRMIEQTQRETASLWQLYPTPAETSRPDTLAIDDDDRLAWRSLPAGVNSNFGPKSRIDSRGWHSFGANR